MRFFLFFFTLIICTSCLDDSSHVNNEINDLTIQAYIEEGEFARVYLTNAIPFDTRIDTLAILKAIEFQAKVSISDSFGSSERLTLNKNEDQYPFIFYQGNILKGKTGADYAIDIQLNGEVFNSLTKVPLKPSINSYSFIDSFRDGVLEEPLKDLKLVLNNNSAEIQYYKFEARNDILDDEFTPASPFIINTENISGDTLSVLLESPTFASGNDLILKVISITEEEYDFLKAIGGDKTTLLEGFTFNEQIPSNIIGNAFGYWAGENSTEISLKVEKK